MFFGVTQNLKMVAGQMHSVVVAVILGPTLQRNSWKSLKIKGFP